MAHTIVKVVEMHKSQNLVQSCQHNSGSTKTNSHPLTSAPCCIEIENKTLGPRQSGLNL